MEKANKQLNRAYLKNFNNLIKQLPTKMDSGLILFVEHLKYIRDTLVITSVTELEEPVKTNVATLVAAIAEFESYQKSTDIAKKEFHWNNFCEFIKLNMEEWLKPNDSI